MLPLHLRDLAFIAIGITATIIIKTGKTIYESYVKDDTVDKFHENYRP